MGTFTRAGEFNRQITLQQETETQDESGDPVKTWSDLMVVWAAAEPDRGREYYAAHGIIAAKPMLFRFHYRPEVTPLCRVLYQGDIYSADSVQDYRDSRTETRIYARTGVNEG